MRGVVSLSHFVLATLLPLTGTESMTEISIPLLRKLEYGRRRNILSSPSPSKCPRFSGNSVKSTSISRTIIGGLLVCVHCSVWGQSCLPADQMLLAALRDREDFVDYVCPNALSGCGPAALSALIETAVLNLRVHLIGKSAGRQMDVFCRVLPRRKGYQFPTLIFRIRGQKIDLVAEDWERGLKVSPVTKNGLSTLEGRALIEPTMLERYRFTWDGAQYKKGQEKCFRVRVGATNTREVLNSIVCELGRQDQDDVLSAR